MNNNVLIEDKLTFKERLIFTSIICFTLGVIGTIITLNNIDIHEYIEYYMDSRVMEQHKEMDRIINLK